MSDTLEKAKSLRIANKHGKGFKHLAGGVARYSLTAEGLLKQKYANKSKSPQTVRPQAREAGD